MAHPSESHYPSVYAQEKLLPKLKNTNILSFENLNPDLIPCFTRLTSPSFPDDYEEDLKRLLSAPINSEAKQLIKTYSSLMHLTNLIESPKSSAGEIFHTVESIEDDNFNKDLFYDIFIFHFSAELDTKPSVSSLKTVLPLLSKIPKHKYEAICDTLFIKISSLVDIGNQDLTYLAETLKAVSDLGEILGLSLILSNIFENIHSKLQFQETIESLPEEFRSTIPVLSSEEIKKVLGILSTAALKPEQQAIVSHFSSIYTPIVPEEPIEENVNKDERFTLLSTLSTSKRSLEYEFHLEGVDQIIHALPVSSWDQIKKIDRIVKIEEKGLEVIRAAIIDETGKELVVAVKINLCDKRLPSISMQAEYMALLHDSKNFLKLYGAFWDRFENKERFTLVMEYGLESLTQRIMRWESQGVASSQREPEALNAAKQLIEAMVILNQKNISHRDIKPDNIFITQEGVYKIADFDVSRKVERNSYGVTEIDKKVSISGTQSYMSPELKAYACGIDLKHGVDYNKCDVYSLGLTILTMLTRKNFMMWNVLNNNLQRDMFEMIDEIVVSTELKKLLQKMLIVDQEERPKFRELLLSSQIVESTYRDEFE